MDWSQGRATFGGLVAAAGVRAMQRGVETDRSLRWLQCVFAGPVPAGRATIAVSTVRRGRSATISHARVRCEDTERVLLTAGFGTHRDSTLDDPAPAAPGYPKPGTPGCPVLPYLEGITPAFTQHTQMAFAEGGFPFTHTQGRSHGGWVRIPSATGARDGATLTALLDVWPAPALQNLAGVAMASTMSWTIHFHPAEDGPADGWCRFRAETEATAEGYHAFRAQLWDDAGQPLASAMQHVAVFG